MSFWQNNLNHLLKLSINYPNFLNLFKWNQNSGKSLVHPNNIILWKFIFILTCREIAQKSGLSPGRQSHQIKGSEGLPMPNHAMLDEKHEKAERQQEAIQRQMNPWGWASPRYIHHSCANGGGLSPGSSLIAHRSSWFLLCVICHCLFRERTLEKQQQQQSVWSFGFIWIHCCPSFLLFSFNIY